MPIAPPHTTAVPAIPFQINVCGGGRTAEASRPVRFAAKAFHRGLVVWADEHEMRIRADCGSSRSRSVAKESVRRVKLAAVVGKRAVSDGITVLSGVVSKRILGAGDVGRDAPACRVSVSQAICQKDLHVYIAVDCLCT